MFINQFFTKKINTHLLICHINFVSLQKFSTMTTFTPPPQSADAQRLIVIVATNYVLTQKNVNPLNPSLKKSPIYRKALAEACYILSEYLLIPHKLVQSTLGLQHKTWASYMQQIIFKCDKYDWFNKKIEDYADAVASLISPNCSSNPPSYEKLPQALLG